MQHVTAKPETVLLRARNRAKVTGRHVPEETILESMRTIPVSNVLCLCFCIAQRYTFS